MACKQHMIVILFQKDMLGWWQLWGTSLSSIIFTHDMTQQTHVWILLENKDGLLEAAVPDLL